MTLEVDIAFFVGSNLLRYRELNAWIPITRRSASFSGVTISQMDLPMNDISMTALFLVAFLKSRYFDIRFSNAIALFECIGVNSIDDLLSLLCRR